VAARDDILSAARAAAAPAREHPGVAGLGAAWDDRTGKFLELLGVVGGTCVRVADLAEADQALRALPVHQTARRVVSLVPGVAASTFDPATVTDPRELAGLDLCVLQAELGVAENGAMWIDGGRLPHRALFVIAEHLAVVLFERTLVDHLHEAYARLRPGGRFGLFLAGPSKTADIEQSLVIGAHGARSLVVLLVAGGAAPDRS
jgi:L-lactate dehydrogenase complex protein LldG